MKTLLALSSFCVAAVTAVSFAAPAVEIDWNRDPVAQLRQARTVARFVAPTRAPVKAESDVTTRSEKPNKDFPVSDADLRALASGLADAENKKDGQIAVGGLLSYTCRASRRSLSAVCDFKFDLGSDIHWFGYEYLKAEFKLVPSVTLIDRTWKRD